MVRILFFISIAAIVLVLTYFLAKGNSKKRNWIVIGGGVLAAAIGVLMQTTFPIHLSLLGILAISIVTALSYAKLLEKEEHKKHQMIEARKGSNTIRSFQSAGSIEKPVLEQATGKSFGMQTIHAVREEQEVGQ